MSEVAKRIIERIKQDIKRGIYVDPQWVEKWERIIDEELEFEQKREDAEDWAAIEEALKEPGPSISWEDVKKELDLP